MTEDPNARQVGGNHYGLRRMQHWDLMALAGADYFAGQITKYTERHARKNGRQDLEKALHFAEKNEQVKRVRRHRNWLTQTLSGIFFGGSQSLPDPRIQSAIRRYAVDAGLTALQERIFEHCLLGTETPAAIVALCSLHLDREYGERVLQAPRIPVNAEGHESAQRLMMRELTPGTPEDGGHHASPPMSDAEFDATLEESLRALNVIELDERIRAS